MHMRLGFAIAVHVDFDILLIDEVLSVGDIAFQEKCLNKLKDFRQKGKTMVIISQSFELLKLLCDRMVLLDKGKIEFMGRPQEVIDRYRDLIFLPTKYQ
jgi:ABC-2 type transport system ATP-binding protein